jgi:hypothetical protein
MIKYLSICIVDIDVLTEQFIYILYSKGEGSTVSQREIGLGRTIVGLGEGERCRPISVTMIAVICYNDSCKFNIEA